MKYYVLPIHSHYSETDVGVYMGDRAPDIMAWHNLPANNITISHGNSLIYNAWENVIFSSFPILIRNLLFTFASIYPPDTNLQTKYGKT